MRPKILLVDDREDNLLSIETILETRSGALVKGRIGEGNTSAIQLSDSPVLPVSQSFSALEYQFVKASSGREALKILLHEFDFALILMDVEMPNLNGFETATLIYEREKLKHIPIIFITAHNYGEENVYKGYRAGAVDYIYKPINGELLRAKVSVFVELYQKNHRLLAQEQKLIAINKSLEAEVNERKNSEEKIKMLNLELLKNIDSLEAANKDLDRFAFMASHDLQEPLRKIYTFSDMLHTKYEKLLDDDGKTYIGKIQSAVKRLQSLIKDILTFSTLTSHKGKFVSCDLNELVKEVLTDVELTVKEKNASVIVGKLPSLNVNPVLIRPLFYNLISNSLKYSKEGVAPVIRIHSGENIKTNEGEKTRKRESEHVVPSLPFSPSNLPSLSLNYVRIYVEDNGIGFDQQYSEQIFSMFTRLHHDKKIEGTGIGLALCKKIVEEHNGFISARSKVNEGSTFIVSLPSATPVNLMKAPGDEWQISGGNGSQAVSQ